MALKGGPGGLHGPRSQGFRGQRFFALGRGRIFFYFGGGLGGTGQGQNLPGKAGQ